MGRWYRKDMVRSAAALLLMAVLTAVLLSACARTQSTTQALAGHDRGLVLGVYRPGADLTEPRPVTSKYLKTYQAGFAVTGQQVTYHLLADVILDRDKPLYMVAEFQNPLDPKQPARYDNVVGPESRAIHLRYGPVHGLKVYDEYWVKVTIFASKDSDKPIDEFIQKIRSYVDTRTDEVKVFKGLKERSK